jgi:hypothetical protein
MAPALVDFHRLALRDYQSAMRWYERKGAHLVQPFKDAVKECVNRIAANPFLGAIYQTQFRWQRTKRPQTLRLLSGRLRRSLPKKGERRRATRRNLARWLESTYQDGYSARCQDGFANG